jgi:hypothetical protein
MLMQICSGTTRASGAHNWHGGVVGLLELPHAGQQPPLLAAQHEPSQWWA